MKLSEQRVLGASFWLVGCSLARLMLTVVARAVVVATFGAEGGDTDAFVAAFRLPQILGDHLLGGTLFLCVLPLLVEVRSRRERRRPGRCSAACSCGRLWPWVLSASATDWPPGPS